MSDQHICAECAAGGLSCCQLSRIFLTQGDERRIREYGCGDSFADHEPPDPKAVDPAATNDPLWYRTFTHPKGRLVIRHQANGDCHFLRETGCLLPLEVWPLVCRLYPFDYTSETIKGVHAHRCPRHVCDNGPLLLALLGMHREDGERWRAQLYRELAEEYGDR